MTKVERFKKRVLRFLDPGKKDRGVLSIQPSGAVEINTGRVLRSPRLQSRVRKMERMALEREEIKTSG
jgi:hypothetical protein